MIEIHTTVNGASFVKWGDFYYGRGPCHAFFSYKVGHLGRILGDFLRTWSFQSRYITWGTGHFAPPSPPHAGTTFYHRPPSPPQPGATSPHRPPAMSIGPRYMPTRPGQLVSKSDPPTRQPVPPPSPPPRGYLPLRPTFLAQSSPARSTGQPLQQTMRTWMSRAFLIYGI